MPVWHDLTKKARESDELVVLGVIQEQHAERCRLFAQWKEFEWPILHDPINSLAARAVPMFVAIDESGVVADANLTFDEFPAFLNQPAVAWEKAAAIPTVSAAELDKAAERSDDAADWIAAGDHRVLWGGAGDVSTAIERYLKASTVDPKDAAARFRLGVAYRMRFDGAQTQSNDSQSNGAQSDDFQSAVDAWDKALDLDPNHYIYRRRIQQYGPRLSKPYPFYDWIEQARAEVSARGDQPITLTVEPVGAEIAAPAKSIQASDQTFDNPDPRGRITRDDRQFIRAKAIVVPGTIRKGDTVRVHLQFATAQTAHWNNEAEPMTVWVDVPDGWKAATPLLTADAPDEPESKEIRHLDFELQSAKNASVTEVKAYALYYICEELGGQCLYRRQDITIPIRFRQ